MTIYKVVMKQAAVLNTLVNNVIYTGPPGVADALQSCSAIILANSAAQTGGLFHYPAGPLNKQPNAKTVIDAMIQLIHPNVAHIVYGRSNDIIDNAYSSLADGNDPDERNTGIADIHSYLLPHVSHVQSRMSTVGAASMGIGTNGVWVGLDQTSNYDQDLENVPAGAYAWGTVLWMP